MDFHSFDLSSLRDNLKNNITKKLRRNSCRCKKCGCLT